MEAIQKGGETQKKTPEILRFLMIILIRNESATVPL
jgi:hypothetical protein